jgi:hypothetical protein
MKHFCLVGGLETPSGFRIGCSPQRYHIPLKNLVHVQILVNDDYLRLTPF